ELLNKFVEHFKVAAAGLTKEAYRTRIDIPTKFLSTPEGNPSYHKMIDMLVANFSMPLEFTEENNILHLLTKKEILCLCYYLMGKTAAEIAKIFEVSPKTASAHLYNARVKLKCKNRSELFQKAIDAGLTNSELVQYLSTK
ncbi:MAG TPA: LuxR C-terminal-related transcriptional regulator, partial [Candidatus Berkiella sp.]|nr:LuxR C-terminal-related transcriptional regulator [Candidatus Berkiella sp.]